MSHFVKVSNILSLGDWEIDQSSSSDDEPSPHNEPLSPDHLTRDE